MGEGKGVGSKVLVVLATMNNAALMLDLLTDLDNVLSSNRAFLLGTWLESAKALATTPLEAQKYEYNARNQITLWGPNGEIRDYANKQWAGVVINYFRPRWELFLGALHTSLVTGVEFNQTEVNNQIFNVELRFTLDQTIFPHLPKGNSVEIAWQLHQKWGGKLESGPCWEQSWQQEGGPQVTLLLISLRQVLSATETTRSENAVPFRLPPLTPANTTNVSFPPPPSSNFGTCFCCQLNEFILWILVSQLTSDGFEKLPDQIMYPCAEPYDLQKNMSLAVVTSDSQHLANERALTGDNMPVWTCFAAPNERALTGNNMPVWMCFAAPNERALTVDNMPVWMCFAAPNEYALTGDNMLECASVSGPRSKVKAARIIPTMTFFRAVLRCAPHDDKQKTGESYPPRARL
uniref:Alpha-N-acetylglucosaminidase C-terminal domain-containing protein n=1 Tax=Timema tahoe TaxID=61484 RepID=A0A7R9P0J0_9NEOP|nr:unnamed protein product [Timema tahoe]